MLERDVFVSRCSCGQLELPADTQLSLSCSTISPYAPIRSDLPSSVTTAASCIIVLIGELRQIFLTITVLHTLNLYKSYIPYIDATAQSIVTATRTSTHQTCYCGMTVATPLYHSLTLTPPSTPPNSSPVQTAVRTRPPPPPDMHSSARACWKRRWGRSVWLQWLR